jgi:hypothetical protein
VQFWAHKEVCVLQFAYCAVVVIEDFDAVEVCCKTVVACVEPEVLKCQRHLHPAEALACLLQP